MKIEYHPAVAKELEEIRDYYDSKSENLGRDFVKEFERQVIQIANMPTRWMTIQDNLRRALMKKVSLRHLFP